MRCHITILCTWLVLSFPSCPADEPASKGNDAGGELKTAKDLLRRASELVAAQDEAQHYWTGHLLLQIVEVQMRASDVEGVQRSIHASKRPYDREGSLVQFAEELAGTGKRQESVEILKEVGATRGERQDHRSDRVLLRWIEHLVESRDLEQAQAAVQQLQSKRYRPDGLRTLAIGYLKSGDQEKAARYFTLALKATYDLEGFERAQALWKTAEAQLVAGEADAAKVTIRQLVTAAEKMEPWSRIAALREAAVLSARLKDKGAADSQLERAIKSIQDLDDNNKLNALQLIALAQARAGYIADALKTAGMITPGESERDRVLFAVAQAQLAADDPKGAIHTTLSIAHAVVDYHVQKGDLKQALAAAEMVDNPSQGASAILRTAIAHARAGNKNLAAEVASRIKLISNRMFREKGEPGFDYRRPDTWGVIYDMDGGFTIGSYLMSVKQAAEVAKHAMTLAQMISLEPKPKYVELFNEYGPEVTQALGRAHAATGDAREAVVWAEKVGSDKKVVSSEDDLEAVRALERRISALVGVAEGMLDRQAKGNGLPVRR